MFQKHLVLALCLHLCRTLGADTDDAQEIPLHAQMLTGAPLVEYLQKNQNLFQVRSTPTPGFKHKLMDVAFANQNSNPIVNDDNDTGADLPEK
ncbi:unnamed protein product [Haemonchus placei]|uniref:Secreted protein n=1 Tax=Haemonchus placei TaxID=6290 RepID=A0A0N4WMQ7_HAEPC|nr:unnamed protein product [Haemonchus placei]